MKFLMDVSPNNSKKIHMHWLVRGQLLTPLTRFRRWATTFAIDNGAFKNFNYKSFLSLLRREQEHSSRCLFVCVPDVVGCHKQTIDRFYLHVDEIRCLGYRIAFVAQDGCNTNSVPWDLIECLFLGGKDPWKDSQEAKDIVAEAVNRGKHSHIGRVNTPQRFISFMEIGANTCDGSGVARYSDVKLPPIEAAVRQFYKQRTNYGN